ncbi:unnamed protein product [Vitrella brassicaformis CCMP3155]|uniref:Uncharacterized protein n=1 Tax=Vitrella brassicaformis (strain CCMP3155) TaxID=1169540 RepID=A0A0G4FT11_VITBC|nr:unnamed protein product [Vitrella brassicaformis CCMP3155]|eukprot:CEM17815.1 unnamed protein product [Vitrella brassicaformis CCMP3155]
MAIDIPSYISLKVRMTPRSSESFVVVASPLDDRPSADQTAHTAAAAMDGCRLAVVVSPCVDTDGLGSLKEVLM